MAVASIVDYLKSRNMDSSYGARKNLASQYGITGYSGTAQQNMSLLKSLQQQSQKSQAAGQQSNANNQNQNKTGPGHPAATYLTDYNYAKFSPSARTTDYADRLDEIENNKPDEYYSKYQGTIDGIIDNILNRKSFDTNSVYDSDLYKNYREQYIQQGQKAMRDTMGAATAATGGYGSTYAQAAGQQAYDNYLSQLNDKSFDIYDRVYQQYLNEGQELYNRLNAVNNQDNIDYSRYRDSVNDYYNDLNYYAGRYDSSYNQDFGAYQTDLSAQQWAEQYAYQKTQDALQLELQRQQLAASLAKKASGGSGGSKSGGKSSKKTSSSATDLSNYVADAKKLLNAKDGHGINYYDDSYVIEYIADKYPSLTDSQIKKVMTQAGGDYDKGLRTLKKITEE